MDKFELQRLRDLPIEGVAGRLGLQVARHKALCPFHDDHHASLCFSPRRGTFRCFACGASGGTIDLVMRLRNLGFKEACKWLADGHNLIMSSPLAAPPSLRGGDGAGAKPFEASRYERFFERPFLGAEARDFLYGQRRLDERVVSWCRLTSWRDRRGTPWLQIPYYDRAGRLVGVQNRNLAPAGRPRFRFPAGSECGIYNLPVLRLLRPGEALYITEGASDCWAMLSAGHKAIAIPSATLLSRKDRELLASLRSSSAAPSFHMYPDRDAPGESLFLALREVLPGLARHDLPPGCKDFADYYASPPPAHANPS